MILLKLYAFWNAADLNNQLLTELYAENGCLISGHIIPVDAYTDIDTDEAADKADEIACHHAEPCPKPPSKPTKKCNAKYDC